MKPRRKEVGVSRGNIFSDLGLKNPDEELAKARLVSAIAKAIKKGHGKAEFTTVAGGKLWAEMSGKRLVLWDEKGGESMVTIADVRQPNGVIHVVDTVLMPN